MEILTIWGWKKLLKYKQVKQEPCSRWEEGWERLHICKLFDLDLIAIVTKKSEFEYTY